MKLAITLIVIGSLGISMYILSVIVGTNGNMYAGMSLFWLGIVPLAIGLWRSRRIRKQKETKQLEKKVRPVNPSILIKK